MSLSLSKRVLNLMYNNPAQSFTVDELLKFPVIRHPKPKRNSVLIYLKRHMINGLIERVHLADGKTWAYRLLKPTEALSFIRNDDNKPWLKVPPNPPELTFSIQNRHRVTYQVHLSKQDLETARSIGEFRPNRRTGGHILLKRKEFSLSVSAVTGRGQVWLFNGWDSAVMRSFSPDLHNALAILVSGREGNEHISVPVEFNDHKIRIGGSSLHLCGSHYPFEIDICGPERDRKKVEAVRMLTEQLAFNAVLLTIRDGIDMLLAKQAATDRNMTQLAKNQADMVQVLNHTNGAKESEYRPGDRTEPDPAIW